MAETRTLAFEIGTEELPAFDLARATEHMHHLVSEAFAAVRIPCGEVLIYSTPRRLVAVVAEVAVETESLVEEYKGPSAKIAFDGEGAFTKAAIGFAKGKGLSVDDLESRTIDGVDYLFAVKNVPARSTSELLPKVLEGIISGISWPKSCRWGTESVWFSRPIRWILALFGEDIVPFEFASICSGNTTRGHRFLAPGDHTVTKADDLLATYDRIFVVPSQEAREALIKAGVALLEEKTGAEAVLPEKTLAEVVNLTEYPTVLAGTFDIGFLRVPEEIIVDAMLMHQRYFPLYEKGSLSNAFVVVSNGDPAYSDNIIDGNERVVRARLADAKFFYEEDLKHPLESYVDRLDEVVFQESLGTMKDKTWRIVSLTEHLVEAAGLGGQDAEDALRAAYLCKADLVCNAVIEFTSVQGIMGSYYAKASHETEGVAKAIEEHYHPRFAQDVPPSTVAGKLVALADKLDAICGLFAVGQGPTGSSDPFALRRNAIGIINMLLDGLPVLLEPAVTMSLASFDNIDFDRDAVAREVLDFFTARTKVILKDAGQSIDVIDAVLAVDVAEPAEIAARVRALGIARKEAPAVMEDLATAFARANNLRVADLGSAVDESLMGEHEKGLYAALLHAEAAVDAALASDDYASALQSLATLREPVDTFFEEVLVMDKDDALKRNRLILLNRFVDAFAHVADFGKIAKNGK